MEIIPFKPEHALRLKLQGAQSYMSGVVTPEYARSLEAAGPAYSGVIDDEVVFCGGAGRMWPGRSILWALLSEIACKNMLGTTRAAERFISTQSGRIEAIVRHDFKQGHRWVRMLGFDVETDLAKDFLGPGAHATLYVRFQ